MAILPLPYHQKTSSKMTFQELNEEITLLSTDLKTLYQTVNQVQQEVSTTLASVEEFLNQFSIV